MSNTASSPSLRGVEQILATADHTTLVVRASRDGKLDVMSNAFVEDKVLGAADWPCHSHSASASGHGRLLLANISRMM
jgi:hypothetical protein